MKKLSVNLIRHGQTEYNLLGKIQGSSNINLSETGKSQAINFPINKNNNYDIAYHSSLSRSEETLKIICNKLVNLPRIENCDLIIERGYGIFEGLADNEIIEKYPDIYQKWKNNENIYIKNAENIENVIDRVKKFILMLAKNNFKNVIAVTHSGVLFALYKYITKTNVGERPQNITFENCSSNILNIYYDSYKINKLEFNISNHTYEYSCGPTEFIIATT
jgi:probable phosphoglycerate mutase